MTAVREALLELRTLQLELTAAEQLGRQRALEQLHTAIDGIRGVAAPQSLLVRAADGLVAGSRFERVLISDLHEGMLTPVALSDVAEPRRSRERGLPASLSSVSIRVDYPLVEAEVARGADARIVDVRAAGERSPAELGDLLGWTSYVVAPLGVNGRTIGLLHADAGGRRALDDLDRDVASVYAAALAGIFELAVLRQLLEHHQDEQWAAVRWLSERLERASPVGRGSEEDAGAESRDPLTPREREVLQLLGRGLTNATIARALTISEGTVKYHVANVLRKLGASSRADAVARELREAGGSA